ncbi:hypothetical protein BO85DRAFT_82009 [Aspergillus piperis CBS 112811]|uniref:Uncharacterized protein n=1 Tax=Aspergillus piperis CBS 112811 TaxID=1448313 RepID=A0A8G1QXA1_9EURO|nr:hypothetical protein BO85DRAFT_82009 [Aspergillus piperis CBS 112811]RAH55262.1 hypothetical protein BO85DRAFT_82009 [Aspergillus piperis CBS 112811]
MLTSVRVAKSETVNYYDGDSAYSRVAEGRNGASSNKEGGSSASRFTRFGRPEVSGIIVMCLKVVMININGPLVLVLWN